jgi:hypothetical protein
MGLDSIRFMSKICNNAAGEMRVQVLSIFLERTVLSAQTDQLAQEGQSALPRLPTAAN